MRRLFDNLKTIHIGYYISLLYLGFPIYYIFLGVYPSWVILPTLGMATAYLGIIISKKVWLYQLFWNYMLLYIFFMTIVIHPLNALFIFYVSNLLVYHFEEEQYWNYYHVTFFLLMLVTALCFFIQSHGDYEALFALLLVYGVCLGTMYITKRMVKQEELKMAVLEKNTSINLLLAENERNRIGQDLHDTLGHVFAMMSIKSELALTLMERGSHDKAKQEVEDLRDITRNAMQEVRQIVQSLKLHSLEEELQILGNMLELAGIALTVEKEEVEIGKDQEAALTMALRELCNNLIKHSQASSCRIQLSERDGWVRVLVEDNGIGFEQVTGEELYSIRDRLIRYQGRVEIISSKQPTQIQLDIPKGEKG